MCDEISHVAKDYPCCVIRATLSTIMRGRGSTRGMRGIGSRPWGGSLGDTILVGGRGKYYAIPIKQEVEAFDVVIKGTFSVCFKFASVLFELGLDFSYVFYFGFCFFSEPLTMTIHVSTPVKDSLVMDWVYQSCVVTLSGCETWVDLLIYIWLISMLFWVWIE